MDFVPSRCGAPQLPRSLQVTRHFRLSSSPHPVLPDEHPENEARRFLLVLAFAAVVFGLDQAAKAVVIAKLGNGRVIQLLGGAIRLDFITNTGAAFSLFRTSGGLFIVIAVAVAVAVLALRGRISRTQWWTRAAIGLIVGGALANALDRIRLGYVVDFIDLRWWPVFNLADSAIVVGAVVLAAESFRRSSRQSEL